MTITPITPGSADLSSLTAAALSRCDELGRLSEAPGRLTRTFLSPPMRQVHQRVGQWMEQAGLRVRIDPAGNIIGRRNGGDATAGTLLIGSHLDTVPDAGRYDGVLGVMLGIAAAEATRGQALPFALEVIGFSEEEGVRFATPYLGSLAVTGRFDPKLLEQADASGVTMRRAIADFGLNPDAIASAAYDPRKLLGYVEVHIEQGPVLEALDLPVGVVETIAGQERFTLVIEGRAGHAGTTPMDQRRDALVGAAMVVTAVEEYALQVRDLRATVGKISAHPNARNIIPGQVELSLDIRHGDDAVRQRAAGRVIETAGQVAHRRGLKVSLRDRQSEPAAVMDRDWTESLASAVRATGVRPIRMLSGAGHDATVLASFSRAAMLFLRSPGGLSHHPDERVLAEDVAVALDALTRFLAGLGRSPHPGSPS